MSRGDLIMDSFIPKKTDKEVISIRLPEKLLSNIDKFAVKYDLSRNEFINQCLTFAIEHIEEKK